jgi:hypothetical protein
VEGEVEPYPFSARQVATRAVVLQGVVAAACEVDPELIIDWYQEQGIWEAVSPDEQAFLNDATSVCGNDLIRLRWRQEAEWALLWVVGKVEHLGLPTHQCDTRRLVDEIIPGLGEDIEPFLASAELRPPGMILAENSRHYDLWCQYIWGKYHGKSVIPSDLLPEVLYQREYAFEWLHGIEPWDDVQCDT